jgi:hypothetical protein
MKNYLTGWQIWETEFNGDQVTMHLLPLRRSEFLQLLPVLDEFYQISQRVGESGSKNLMDMGTVLEKIDPVFSEHVKDISGFLIDGQAPTVEVIVAGSVFMPLISNAIFRLVEISKISKDEEKNSGGQSTNPP